MRLWGLKQPVASQANPNARRFKKAKPVIILVLALILLSTVIYVIKFKNKNSFVPEKLTSAQQLQANQEWQKNTQNSLDVKDYEQYQMQQLSVVGQYVDHGDYLSAQNTISDIFSKVPQDKIIASTYYQAITVAEGQHDSSKKKDYVNKLIALLNSQGQTAEAAYVQKNLGGQ